jgi:hypothetical protein
MPFCGLHQSDAIHIDAENQTSHFVSGAAMRAEIETIVTEIQQAVSLLRRHL